ncbi:FAD-dependent oxidoreductase [Streptomyces hilarionis]|uniref:FAD-dependent oxidoreductase n=1 Tax=Streptomyces hilarionis TaxID=2839954 RepID=UPI00211A00CB|nr:FAD-dependent oxidoreductase [Streptomyces hilarionis]MCQ9131799.1 FAD-dependent oxidoreductase [Streptomyces hilarionis]
MSRPRVVIAGAGLAGYRAARTLARAARGRADITLVNPTDHFLHLPALPLVAAGALEPHRVAVSLSRTLRGVRLVLGEDDRVDLDARTVRCTGPEGEAVFLGYDRLVLAVGGAGALPPVPGVAEHAYGCRDLPEALWLRDHLMRQVEAAASGDDAAEQVARCTFVVAGAGWTGAEVAARGKPFTDALVRDHPARGGMRPRWLLFDAAERVLPELDERHARTAERVLRARGVEVRTGTSVQEATHEGVLLSDGEFVQSRTLVWCVGAGPGPLTASLGLPMERGRLLVEPTLQVPGRPEVFACGDAAAVPDLDRPGEYTPTTAWHARRQGGAAAHNVAASLDGSGALRPYRYRDPGYAAGPGHGRAAAGTRRLAAMPGERVRGAADRLLDAVLPRRPVQWGLVRPGPAPLDSAPQQAAPPGPARIPRVRGRAPTVFGPGAATEEDVRATAPAAATAPTDRNTENTDRNAENDAYGVNDMNTHHDRDQVSDVNDVNDENQTTGGPDERRPSPEDGSQSITSPTPEVGRHGSGADGPRTDRSSPEDGSQSITSPTPEVGQHSSGPATGSDDRAAEPARNQPGGEPAKNQPGGEPARNQPPARPADSAPERAEGNR